MNESVLWKAGGAPVSDPARMTQGRKPGSETGAPARRRLFGCPRDPFLVANWERVFFLHYLLDPKLLRAHIPAPFELELYHGEACISLVAVTMRRFRPYRHSLLATLFRTIKEQRFLNLRTYGRWRDEPGAFFLWGWLSQPLPLPLPSSLMGLCYSFASLNYQHNADTGQIRGSVCVSGSSARLAYAGQMTLPNQFEPSPAGSLAEFALERYSGFFCRGKDQRVFRAWHPPWMQAQVQAAVEDVSLIETKFPWFKHARLDGANLAANLPGVLLGRPHRICDARGRQRHPSGARSAFVEMP